MTDSAHYRGDMPASKYDSMDADTPDGTCSTCGRKASEVVCADCGKCRVCDCGCEAVIVDNPDVDATHAASRINAALEDNRQAIIRKRFQESCRNGGPKHYVGSSDTFDEIAGGMLARRDHHAKLLVIPDAEYGA